ncbi:unnamed protein product [Protopolystoma xenopodis]|uniref:Uncharacterized protein n=1 Tax=Protopolystoma xenopodis TaxID=117903 RepID=A0A448X2D4_9PLAT|nr:unnamed protein product [Protopolystoma xenopodis]
MGPFAPSLALAGSRLSALPTGLVAGPTRLQAMDETEDTLSDPTNPDCPFARLLPAGGASALVRLSRLPAETKRKELHAFLGSDDMAKIYRMKRMVSNYFLTKKQTANA